MVVLSEIFKTNFTMQKIDEYLLDKFPTPCIFQISTKSIYARKAVIFTLSQLKSAKRSGKGLLILQQVGSGRGHGQTMNN